MSPHVKALKLACDAFYRRLHTSGLNSFDSDAFRECKNAVKAETGELYASGQWFKDQFTLGENV